MITMTIEAESFEQLVKNLCAMLDRCGALDVAEVQQKYRLTYSMLWNKMGEFDLEFGSLAAMDLMAVEYNALTLSELPLDNWHEYYDLLEGKLDEKHLKDQNDDAAQELAW